MEGYERLNSKFEERAIRYFTTPLAYIVVSALFLMVGIFSLLFFDYGKINFLFPFDHFLFTGVVPIFIALCLQIVVILDSQRVLISSNGKQITVQTKLIRTRTVEYECSNIKYIGLRFKETKTLKWIFIFTLILTIVEILIPNTIDLYNTARIAPILLIFTILLSLGTIIFIFSPRRFLEIGTNDEIVLIPYQNLSSSQRVELLNVLGINKTHLQQENFSKRLVKNITSQLLNFTLGCFLFLVGIIFVSTPLFFGAFTRVIMLSLGLKFISKVFNNEFFNSSPYDQNLFVGESVRLTFLQTRGSNLRYKKFYAPLKWHPLELTCFIYLKLQAIRYSFRNIWWSYMNFSVIYFLIGFILLILIFIEWFSPKYFFNIGFHEFSIELKTLIHTSNTSGYNFTSPIRGKVKIFFNNFKSIANNQNLAFSIILFLVMILWPVFYSVFGGNFFVI